MRFLKGFQGHLLRALNQASEHHAGQPKAEFFARAGVEAKQDAVFLRNPLAIELLY
jgi:hypothetical protein